MGALNHFLRLFRFSSSMHAASVQCRALRELDDRLLRDIGLTREDLR